MADETKDDLSASSVTQDAVALTESGSTAKKSRARSKAQASDETEGTVRKRGRKPARKKTDPETSEAVTGELLLTAEKPQEADTASEDSKPARPKRTRRTTSRTRSVRPGSRTSKSKEAAEESPLLTVAEENAAEPQEGTSSQPEKNDNAPAEKAGTATKASQPQRDWSSWKGWDDDEADSEPQPAAETAKAASVTPAQPVLPLAKEEKAGTEPATAEPAPEAVPEAPRQPRRKKPARTAVKGHMAGRIRRETIQKAQPDTLKSAEELHDTDPLPENDVPLAHDFEPSLPLMGEDQPSLQEQDGLRPVSSYEEDAPDAADATAGQDFRERNFADPIEEDADDYLSEDEPEDLQRTHRRGRRGGRSHKKAALQTQPASYDSGSDQEQAGYMPSDNSLSPRGFVPARHARRRMFISVLPGEQVEVAFTTNGILDEYYLDMLHQKKIKGNIYRGVIVNIDVNLQAAFVDFGTEKNGFLQIDEVHPEYFITTQEFVRGRKSPPIQKVLRLGQEVLVQVVKEPNGSKGAFLTTWISLAGRFLVLTPGQEQIAISRKVKDEEERRRLRELMNGIDPGDDLGVIVRTVSAGVTQATLKTDLAYLKRTWNEVRKQAAGVAAPACVYREPGLVERAVRDYLTDDVYELWVDNADVAERIKNTVALLFPHKKDLVRVHNDNRHSLWERFNLRRQLDQIYSREVLMPSGGRLVFDQTEALMAIDINSGKISCKGNFEHMAFRTNMEAAETIARQLKLRDVGGQVVIDFIEMREHKHVLEVERTLRNAMKNDKARHDIQHMSSFGLLELVRQRTATSAISISMEPCPCCGGTGLRRNLEWQSLQALRDIARMMRGRSSDTCRYEMSQELGLYVLNHKREALKELEALYGKSIEIAIHP